MKSALRITLIVAAVTIVVGGLIYGFLAGRGEQAAEEQRDAPVKAPSRISSEGGHTMLSFDASAQHANGIVTTLLTATKESAEAQATGVVVQLQPLLDLKASYNTPATDLIRARANSRASSAEYERLRMLNQDGRNASDKSVEAARATAVSDAALAQNAEQAIGLVKDASVLHWGPVVAGWIETNSPQLQALLMQQAFLLQVTGTNGGAFASPKRATVQYPDRSRGTARFVSVLPQLDPRLQIPSLLYLIAPHPGLAPGVNLSVFLHSGQAQTGVIVPSSAVVWSEGQAWCYVEQSPGKFDRRAVSTGSPEADGWFVTEGILPSTRVVTSGAQTLLSEEFRAQIQQDQD